MINPEIDNYILPPPASECWPGERLLQFLAGKLRIRRESGRNRLDMRDVMHLEILMHGIWTPISTTDLEEI